MILQNNMSIKETTMYNKYCFAYFRLFVGLLGFSIGIYMLYNIEFNNRYLLISACFLIGSFFSAAVLLDLKNQKNIFTKYKTIDKISIDDEQIIIHIGSKMCYLYINGSVSNINIDVCKEYIFIQFGNYYLCSKNNLDKTQINFLSDSIKRLNKYKLSRHYGLLLSNNVKYELSNSVLDKTIIFLDAYKSFILYFFISIILFVISVEFFNINSFISVILLIVVGAFAWGLIYYYLSTFLINRMCYGKGQKFHIEFNDNMILFFTDGYLIDVKDISYVLGCKKINNIYIIYTVNKIIILKRETYNRLPDYILDIF